MSEETARTETGQFTAPAAIPETIVEQREQAAGYVPLTEEQFSGLAPSEDAPITVEEAAADLTASRTSEADIQTHSPIDAALEKLDDNVTLTPEQAARLTTATKEAEAKALEEAELQKVREEVDAARGVEPDPIDAVDGLDVETRRALKIPQVRSALESEFQKIDETRTQYSQGLQAAQQFGQAALLEIVPELGQLPLEQWGDGLNMLAQVDPARAQTAANMLQRVGQIQQAQQQAAQYQAQQHQAQMREYGKSEDTKFKAMIGPERMKQVEAHLVPYLAKVGIDKDQFAHALQTNPMIRSAEAQKLIADAIGYDLIRSATPKPAPKGLPPVQKPGTSNRARASSPSAQMASLERALDTATGDKAIRISAQLQSLKRARG